MKYSKSFLMNFMALCCVLGLVTKKLVNPFANVITEVLHIPGGISTGFSIMFLIIAAEIVNLRYAGTLMGCVQGFLAVAMGRVGSMGIFMPLGYIVPGIAIDLVYYLARRANGHQTERMVFANALAAVMASVTANLLVFHLHGPVLWLYLGVSATSGSLYGFLGSTVVTRLQSVVCQYQGLGWKCRNVKYETMHSKPMDINVLSKECEE